jgi:PAS domain S-box-containing protein
MPCGRVFNIVNETTRAIVENPVEKVLKSGRIVGLANHSVLIRRDGSEIPIDDSGAPITQKDGSIAGVILVFRDFREQKKAGPHCST